MTDEANGEDLKKERKGWDDKLLPFDTREVVAKNVSGSTAGAGSGDFHVYRQLRRKELFRIEEMDRSTKQREEDKKVEAQILAKKQVEEDKTMKRAAKRRKRKQKIVAAKLAKKTDTSGGEQTNLTDVDVAEGEGDQTAEALKPDAEQSQAADNEVRTQAGDGGDEGDEEKSNADQG